MLDFIAAKNEVVTLTFHDEQGDRRLTIATDVGETDFDLNQHGKRFNSIVDQHVGIGKVSGSRWAGYFEISP